LRAGLSGAAQQEAGDVLAGQDALARPACWSFQAAWPRMFIRQPQSALTTRSAPVALSGLTLSSTMAPEISGCLIEKVPPKPQHSDS
jgi:hypothetical protein